MNIEIVATKLQGTYSCGMNPPPDSNILRSGWATDTCSCNNGLRQSNCGRLLEQIPTSVKPADALSSPVFDASIHAADCSTNHSRAVDPTWFATCQESSACIRITVTSSLPNTFNIGNSTDGELRSLGFLWCIDHTNAVLYVKMQAAAQPQQPPFYSTYFELDDDAHPGHACRFLATHWVSGNVVRVYQQDPGRNCTSSYSPSQLPGPDGVTNATLHIA
jgi:hypothetical protein